MNVLPKKTQMKTLILRIAILTSLATATPIALAQVATFPDVGKSYNISWAQVGDGRLADGKIKVIRKTDGPWIFVEYTYMRHDPSAHPPRPGIPKPPGSATPPGPPPISQESWTPVTKQLWINTHWIITASELEPEKK